MTTGNNEPWYARVRFTSGRRVEAVRDSYAEAQAWRREQAASGEVASMSLVPQRLRQDIRRRLEEDATRDGAPTVD